MQRWQNKLQKNSSYGSHLPVIVRVVEATNGPILELGMGTYSTPILDLLCRESKRLLVSYDNDPDWFEKNKAWECDFHKVYFVDNYDKADIDNVHWGVAIIDHKPAERRIIDIERLAQKVNFLIVHDTEETWEKDFHYRSVFPLFKYRYDYTICRPATTILSNFFDPSELYK